MCWIFIVTNNLLSLLLSLRHLLLFIILFCQNLLNLDFEQSSLLRNDSFYFNHFSLIIFYHSVWLGFELFGLRVQVCHQLVQFMLACKGYDNHHCHNKPQAENEAGVWMTSCPEEMGWEFGRFWKRFSWVLTMVLRSWSPTIQSSRQTIENGVLCHRVEFSTIAAVVKFFGSRPVKMNWDLKHHGGVVSIVWLRKTFKNCLSPHVEEPKSEVNKCVRIWIMESACLYLY